MFSQLDPTLALVLLYDFLLGKGICCGGPLKRMIHKHKAILMETFSEISSNEIPVSAVPPGIFRTDCSIRIFRIKWFIDCFIRMFIVIRKGTNFKLLL